MKPEFIHRLCVVVGLFGCGRHHDVARADEPPAGEVWLTQEQIAAAKISVTPAEEHVVDDVIVTSGAFAFDDQRVGHVVSPVNGRVVRVNVELGQQVKRGEALAVIDSPDVGIASSELGKANADLLATRHEYERQKELFDQHAASQRDYEQAEDAFRKSQAELDRARQKAKLLQTGAREEVTQGYVLRAPLDGEVLTRNVTPGGEVQGQYGGGSAAELFTVGELGRVWLFSDVYEMDMARVKNGAKVTVRVVAYPDETFDGKVEWVSGVLDPVSRTAKVRCTFDNKERRLKPNMYATVNISVDASKALAIPRAAMLRLGDTTVVFVERGQIRPGKLRFERAVVVVDDQGGPWLKVRHGIEGGDRVVTAGAILLTGMM